MKSIVLKVNCALALLIGGILAAGPVMADKPAWAGAGKSGKDERMDRRDEQKSERRDEGAKSQHEGASAGQRSHFEDRHRTIVREYYAEQFRSGHCPPGLAKKQNGCMPPGQARKWELGRPLPHDVRYYSVPQPLVVQIGPPPSGYRYVRVAGDILMIAIATGIVVDAIQDMGH